MNLEDVTKRMALYYCPNCDDYKDNRTSFTYDGFQQGVKRNLLLYTHRFNLDGSKGCGFTYTNVTLKKYMREKNEQ